MAGTLKTVFQGIRGNQDRRMIDYHVFGATDDNDALDSMETGSPVVYDNMSREDIAVTEVKQRSDVNGVPIAGADNFHRCTAIYTRRPNRKSANPTNFIPDPVVLEDAQNDQEEPDKESFSWEVSLGTQREYAPLNSKDTGNGGQMVQNDTGDNTRAGGQFTWYRPYGFQFEENYGYRGIDVLRPESTFTMTINPDGTNNPGTTPGDGTKVTRSYQVLVQDMVGKLNNAPFRRWATREVLCVGARGESRNSTDWEIVLSFRAKRHRTSVDFGNNCTLATLEAWDYPDIHWVWQPFQGVMQRMARQVTVWRLYQQADFKTLFP